ncbi:MAG: IS630 family transposase [Chloroflexota bacterium]
MIQMTFSFEEIEALVQERFTHPHPFVRRKMEAVLLKSQNLPHKMICQLCGICGNTLRNYLDEYQAGGLEKLEELRFYRPESPLEEHRELVQTELALHPVATVKQARSRIWELTGLKRGLTQVREWLGRCRLKRRKVGMIPAKADPQKQAAYRSATLEPRLQEAQAGQRLVFFVDAAHFVLQPFLGFLWCVKRVFIKAPSGRQRLNVLGALEAVSHRLITVSNETYITAASVCELLRLIAVEAAGRPVTIILDNARYQHCAVVKSLAGQLNLELAFLPSYSPNLNLIERLWKFVKKQCLYSEYYADFAAFKTAILQCLAQTHERHKTDLDTLLTFNFQTFEEAQSMAV